MSQQKGLILISLAIAASFIWGYRGQAPEVPEAISTPAAMPKTAAPAINSFQDLPSDSSQNPPKLSANPSWANPPRPNRLPPSAVVADPNGSAEHDQNPYRQFMLGTERAVNLDRTLDSISPGQREDSQYIRRNAYFEKLSQQLKELRGEPPPIVPSDNQLGDNSTNSNNLANQLPDTNAIQAPFANPIGSAAQVDQADDREPEDSLPVPPPRLGPQVAREEFLEPEFNDQEYYQPDSDSAADDALVDEIVDILE